MAEAWCEPCDMTKAFCVHGQPSDKLEATGPTIFANTHTDCAAACGVPLKPGDQITYTREGWAHTHETAKPDDLSGMVE